MLKTDFKPILVNFWWRNLGVAESIYFEIWRGGIAPLAPMVSPPMSAMLHMVAKYKQKWNILFDSCIISKKDM